MVMVMVMVMMVIPTAIVVMVMMMMPPERPPECRVFIHGHVRANSSTNNNMRSGTNRITARIALAAKVEPTMIVWKEDDWGSSMRRKQTLKLDVADLIARRI